jgi:predicted permease
MNQRGRPLESRALFLTGRAFEIFVGVLVAIPALFFITMSLGGLAGLAVGLASDRSDWRLWAGTAVGLVVGGWCAQIAWRLFTRHERRGGGLLSPLVLALCGLGCLAGSIATIVYDSRNLAWIRLLSLAVAFFGLARYRFSRERTQPQAA